MKFTVMRRHTGDRQYNVGDTREATENVVKHLVDRGVLKPIREKKADAPDNKAVKSAPKNKAAD